MTEEAEPQTLKRKLESALLSLDSAVASLETAPRKKRRKAPVSTPALVSLLPRDRQSVEVDATYDLSLPALLARINTFRPSAWSYKPAALSPPACSLLGWTNSGRDRLQCVTCQQGWLVLSPSSKTWSDTAGKRLAEQHVQGLKSKHGSNCPWRFRGVSKATYRVQPWHSKSQAHQHLEKAAANLRGIAIISSSDIDLIKSVLVKLPLAQSSDDNAPVLALLGWEAESPDSIALSCHYCGRRALRSKYTSTSETIDKRLDPFSHEAFCAYLATDDRGRPAWRDRLAFLGSPASDNDNATAAGDAHGTTEVAKYKPLELRQYVDKLLGPRSVIVKRASVI